MVLAATTNPRSMQARDERAAGEDAELKRKRFLNKQQKMDMLLLILVILVLHH